MDENILVRSQTVKRMLSIIESFGETPDSVINRLLDFYIQYNGAVPGSPPPARGGQGIPLDPLAPPSLRYTKLIFAKLNGKELPGASWNGLVDEVLRSAWSTLRSFPALQRVAHINMVEGNKRDQGYRYLADLGLSVQGQDANDAWRCVARLAQSQAIPVEVGFIWRDNPAAAYPGETGHMAVGGIK